MFRAAIASVVLFPLTSDAYAGSTDDTRMGWTVSGWRVDDLASGVKAEYRYNQKCAVPGVCTAPPILSLQLIRPIART
jgi:hypothetical protein